MSKPIPQTVSELFPSKWLKPNDLNGRSVTVTIRAVSLEELHNPRTNKKELIAVLDFGRTKKMYVNKTQALDIADIAKSESFGHWPGVQITLSPAVNRSGKPTISVRPAPAAPVNPE